MNFRRGQLLRRKFVAETDDSDKPYLLIRGPYEECFEKKALTELILVVDVLVEGKVVIAVPVFEFERWV